MNIPITQSPEWKKLQDDLDETSFLVSEASYHYLAILKSTPVGKYLYLPYGPIAKDQSSFNDALQSLATLASNNRAIFIRIEPRDLTWALPKNAHKSTDLNPAETWVLDLTGKQPSDYRPNELYTNLDTLPSELKTKLPSRLLRYYRGAGKKGITIRTSHDPADIHYLLDLQRALGKEKGISTFSESYLQTELRRPFATLYLVNFRDENTTGDALASSTSVISTQTSSATPVTPTVSAPTDTIIAAGLVFDDATARYNLQGAQSDLGRRLHATGILTVQLILDAYAKGLKTFDFWGIAPDDAPADHPWAGFTAFKKTFAGREVKYHGTYDLVLNSVKYKLYQSMRALNRKINKA